MMIIFRAFRRYAADIYEALMLMLMLLLPRAAILRLCR